jgi:hypothetical protein
VTVASPQPEWVLRVLLALSPATLGAYFRICLRVAASVSGDETWLPQFSVNLVEQISVLEVAGDFTAHYEMLR